KMALWVLRFAVVASVFFGSLKEARAVWCLGDIGVGAMAWINIIAILLLSGKPVKALRMYERQQKAGKVPHFDPDVLGISGADYWKENNKQNNP
ncbi:MAG: alanine:cation symporter family protein, partial [Bacteroidales bacterium]|nr:alanine:cation symporter family protein [Bacteroidales bacterium]